MSAVLKIIDETPGIGRSPSFELRLASERISVRELITKRVNDEIDQLQAEAIENAAAHERTRSFLIRFDPSSPEGRLNSPRAGFKPKRFDRSEETRAACEAFAQRRFLILIDDRQIEDLDEELVVAPHTEVVFLRLVPLRGG